MANYGITIIYDADKWLFAEDLVSFVMNNVFSMPFVGTYATPHRALIPNNFNETVRVTIEEFVRSQLSLNVTTYQIIETTIEHNDFTFNTLMINIFFFYRPAGFHPEQFLLYCANVTIAAAIFRNKGFENAPNLAVREICGYMALTRMQTTEWRILNAYTSDIAALMAGRRTFMPPDETIFGPHQPDNDALNEQFNAQQRKNDNGNAAEENTIQTHTADSKDSVDNKTACSGNLESSCQSTRKEHLQPNDVFKFAIPDVNESTKEIPVAVSTDKNLQTVNTLQDKQIVTQSIDAKSELEIELTDMKGLNAEVDSPVLQKSVILKEDREQLCTFDERETLSEDYCTIAKQEDLSKSYISAKLPTTSLESPLQKVKAGSSKKPIGENRISVLNSKQHEEKKLKQ